MPMASCWLQGYGFRQNDDAVFLLNLQTHRTKVITVEDPVEYVLSGINQVQVNNQAV